MARGIICFDFDGLLEDGDALVQGALAACSSRMFSSFTSIATSASNCFTCWRKFFRTTPLASWASALRGGY